MNMNEINEIPKEVVETPKIPETQEITAEFNSVKDVWSDFVNSIKEFSDSVFESSDTSEKTVEAREYGVNECADVAKECFSPEIIREWGSMDLESRDKVIQEYAEGIGEA